MLKGKKETQRERTERAIRECYPRMKAIAKIEVLFDQILLLLPIADSKELKKILTQDIATV
ncbi:MAG: hypothetical protein A3D90_02005 [Sulfuricurvum sp. RIFCSPHIGHO2_02_FULL_43_9]|nr:MAG: hypothetical protein A3D90_02005 [Sulfuricurvum sp. RIFCSPHIGHO2_02_FULL_43_9]OHD89071.1 MAG: hypothetical protein A3G19_07740 [Sulfuricurvum sp. RIFCSPLOWO2_12_FULL_43_24]